MLERHNPEQFNPIQKEKTPSEQIMELLSQYGSIKNIPESAIPEGYIKNDDGTRLIKAEYWKQPETLETKNEKRPFEPFEMEVRISEEEYKFVSKKHLRQINDQCNELEFRLDNTLHITYDGEYFTDLFPKQSKYPFLVKRFKETLPSSTLEPEDKKIVTDIVLSIFDTKSLSQFKRESRDTTEEATVLIEALYNLQYGEVERLLDEPAIQPETTGIGPELSKKISVFLERLKGKAGDVNEMEKRFIANLEDTEIMEPGTDAREMDNYDHYKETIRRKGITTDLEFIAYHFDLLITTACSDLIAPELLTHAESVEEIRKHIALLIQSAVESLSRSMVELNRSKRKSKKEPDNQLAISQLTDAQALVSSLNEYKKLLEGMNDYFYIPEAMSQKFIPTIDQIQRNFKSVHRSKKISETVTLDPRIDTERDANPGKISGDCTEDKPLPFLDPEVPIYNIKIFENQDDHVGNIYLLTADALEDDAGIFPSDTDKSYGTELAVPVWHIDAIQIPKSNIIWKEFLPSLLTKLIERAKEKNITAISINSDPALISNYDYIRNGVVEAIPLDSFPKGLIKIPQYSHDRYKEMQSTGFVRLIWQAEKN